jgi:RNA polymerase sigma factor (sigma-70 family)
VPAELSQLLSASPTPLESLLAFGFVKATAANDVPTAQLLGAFLDTTLEELVRQVRQTCLAVSRLPPLDVCFYCARLLTYTHRSVGELLSVTQKPITSPALLHRVIGKITLRHVASDNAASTARWQRLLVEAQSLYRTMEKDTEAFADLFNTHEQLVFGYIRMRTRHDQDAQDIAQETWKQVLTKMSTYDPAYGTFLAFAKYWANLVLRRYYAAEGKYRLRTTSLHTTAQTAQEVEAALVRPIFFEEVLRATFATASPPHQLLVFGFCKLLAWKPSRIVSDASDTPLRELATQFETAYINAVHPPADRREPVQISLAPLHAMMDRPLYDVFYEDRTRQTYPDLLWCMAGESTLAQYYKPGQSPAAQITQWWFAVTRRVLRDL